MQVGERIVGVSVDEDLLLLEEEKVPEGRMRRVECIL